MKLAVVLCAAALTLGGCALPNIKDVDTSKAQHRSVAALIANTIPGGECFECYHPSPLVLRGGPHNRAQILKVLKDVRQKLDGG